MFPGVFGSSILKRAVERKYIELYTHDIRDYTYDKHHRADDYPFGGGAGMVMMVEPIARCIEQLQSEREYDGIYLMAPDGTTFIHHRGPQHWRLRAVGRRTGGHGHQRRHRTGHPRRHQRRRISPFRLLPRQPALCTCLYTSRGLPRSPCTRCTPLRQSKAYRRMAYESANYENPRTPSRSIKP